jgi:hypothetical protein
MVLLTTILAELHILFGMLLLGYVVTFNIGYGPSFERGLKESGIRSAELEVRDLAYCKDHFARNSDRHAGVRTSVPLFLHRG